MNSEYDFRPCFLITISTNQSYKVTSINPSTEQPLNSLSFLVIELFDMHKNDEDGARITKSGLSMMKG